MAHSYSFNTPNVPLDQDIVRFLEDFYRISDTPGNHDNYVDQFTDDATFIVAHKKNHGHDEIMRQRLSMWDHVKERKHTIYNVYPFGNDPTKFMIHGHVEYLLKTDEKKGLDWAGKADLAKISGCWKLQFYQIWL